jgi:hypothetical protein
MTRERKLALAGAVLAAATIAIAAAARTSASEKSALARLSNEGRSVSMRGGDLARRLGVRQASLLAVRGSRAFYRIDAKGGPCVAAGPAADPGQLGTVDCPRGSFPSPEHPVVDLSVYEATSHERREVSLYRAEGIAADGVAAVAFLRPGGSIALEVPVSGNVFSTTSVPPGRIVGLEALDAAGNELWRSP